MFNLFINVINKQVTNQIQRLKNPAKILNSRGFILKLIPDFNRNTILSY